MSDSIDDFPRVLRGYDPGEVNKVVGKLRRELLVAKTTTDEQANRIGPFQAQEHVSVILEFEAAAQAHEKPDLALAWLGLQ